MTTRPPIGQKVRVRDGNYDGAPYRTVTVKRHVGKETLEVQDQSGELTLYHMEGVKEAGK